MSRNRESCSWGFRPAATAAQAFAAPSFQPFDSINQNASFLYHQHSAEKRRQSLKIQSHAVDAAVVGRLLLSATGAVSCACTSAGNAATAAARRAPSHWCRTFSSLRMASCVPTRPEKRNHRSEKTLSLISLKCMRNSSHPAGRRGRRVHRHLHWSMAADGWQQRPVLLKPRCDPTRPPPENPRKGTI